MPNLVNPGQICLYADDINFQISNKETRYLEELAFIQLSQISQNLTNQNLLVNPEKTKFISFSTPKNNECLQPNIIMGDCNLEEVQYTTFLGLEIDKNLTWNLHIN